MAKHTQPGITLEMGARVHPLGDSPHGAAAQAAAPTGDDLPSKWLLCLFAPVLGFVSYFALAHLFFNLGHLVESCVAVISNNLTVNTDEFQNIVELGVFLDYIAREQKNGQVHLVADVVGFNESINYFDNKTISRFTSYANFSIGTRTSGNGKPLHWTSCLKIVEDLATGLLHIHQNPGLTHGNLNSSNILLGSDIESCLTDYGLMSFKNLDVPEESSAFSLFYRAPECRDPRRHLTQQADIYSFGVLLLELLTGKTPFQDIIVEHGLDIPKWVKAIREEEIESGDEPTSSGNEASEEKLMALLNIAMVCVSLAPENRPVMKEVLRMIRETRAEAVHASSNSSDHSPGRWSDTVQSLPRDEHLSI